MSGSTFPPGYVAAAQLLLDLSRRWIATHPEAEAPRFQLPPRDVFFVAPLVDVAPAIALNASARELLDHCLEREPAGGFSVAMFGAVLDLLGCDVARVSLGALGLRVGRA